MRKAIITLCLLSGCATVPEPLVSEVKTVDLPDLAPVELKPYAVMTLGVLEEPSGMVKSRRFPDVYWNHNDSGDEARIFAFRRDGAHIEIPGSTEAGYPYEGILIPDTSNIDWEDIATDNAGNLIIGAFGNNHNARRDLAVYYLNEPNPLGVYATRSRKRIDFHFPDQTRFPPEGPDLDFDCEALFAARGKLYFLTKHRGNTRTKLYRMDRTEPGVSNPLTYLATFELHKFRATAADASPDGAWLAVLTYYAVWVFHQPDGSDNYFDGEIYWLPIKAGQCEAICWDDPKTFIIGNEERELFSLSLSDLIKVR